jgi:cytochrome b
LSKVPIVWSKITRILHWGLAFAVVANFVNDGDGEKDIHRIVGYVAAGIVALRIVYGFLGKSSLYKHHLFARWPLGLSALTTFLRREMSSDPLDYEGHNPAASWTYLGIIAAVMSLGVTGFMMGLDAFWGEEWLEELHEVISNLLLGLVVAHLLGVAKDAYKFKRKTWNRMITGRS